MGVSWAKKGRHKTRQAVWRDIKRAAKAFRLPQNVGSHSMRKVYAVRLMQKYGSIDKVKRNLNHDHAGVTVIYAMADQLLEQRLAVRARRAKQRKKREEEKAREREQQRECEGQIKLDGM